jgi:hypothetical protein
MFNRLGLRSLNTLIPNIGFIDYVHEGSAEETRNEPLFS